MLRAEVPLVVDVLQRSCDAESRGPEIFSTGSTTAVVADSIFSFLFF